MALRIKWDQYETALLIDTFWKIEEHPELRQDLIKKLSNDLRKKAINQGVAIDDTFRNVNGITMQLTPIAHSFFPERASLSSTAMFDSIVNLYKEDKPAYDRILEKAKQMVGDMEDGKATVKDRKIRFTEWLASNGNSASEISTIVSAIDSASVFVKNRKILPYTFWNVETEVEFSIASAKLMIMRYFRLFHKTLVAQLTPAIPLYSRFLDEELRQTEESIISGEDSNTETSDQGEEEQHASVSETEIETEHQTATDEAPIEANYTNSFHEIPFDRTEIIFIIDNFILSENGTKEISQAIAEVSDVLRKRAEFFEQEIDADFRSKEMIARCFSDVGRCIHSDGAEPVGIHPLILQLTDLHKNDLKRYLLQSKTVWEQLSRLCIVEPGRKNAEASEGTAGIVESEEKPQPEKEPESENDTPVIKKIDDELLIDSDFLPDKAYAALKEECLKNEYGTTAFYIANKIRTTEKTVINIFSKAEWAKLSFGKYKLSDDNPGENKALNLNKPSSLAFTRPIKLVYFEETVSNSESWRGLFWDFICALFEDYPERINSLAGKVLPGDIVPLIKTSATSKTTVEFAPGLYVELNIPANTVAEYIKQLLEYCDVDLENISIFFSRKDLSAKESPKQKTSGRTEETVKIQQQSDSIISPVEQTVTIEPKRNSSDKEAQEKATKTVSQLLPGAAAQNKRALGKKYYQVEKELFYIWLQEKKSIDSKEASAYIRILQAAEDFAKEYISENCKLFSADKSTVESTLKQISTNKSFRISIINNRPNMVPAMKLFLEYHALEPKKLNILSDKQTSANATQKPISKSESELVRNPASESSHTAVKKARLTIKDAIADALEDADTPLTAQEILDKIEREGLYHYFNSKNKLSLVLYELKRFTKGVDVQNHAPQSLFICYTDDEENVRWRLISKASEITHKVQSVINSETAEKPSRQLEKAVEVNKQWKESDIRAIMTGHFQYGLNVGSPIELHRLRNYYKAETGMDFPESDETLKKAIRKLGFEFEGKTYIVSDSVAEKILQILRNRSESGCMFYYSLLYERNEDWLFEGNILSSEMLKEYLIRKFPENKYKNNYFTTKNSTDTELRLIRDEMLNAWGETPLCRIQQLCERLPYITQEKIRYTLSYSSDFIRSEAETYARRDKFALADEELQEIIDFIREKCEEDGSVALEDLMLDDIAAENYEWSEPAIYAMISTLLPKEFSVSGRLITKTENSTGGEAAILNFCKNHDTCKLQELEEEMERAVGYIRTDYVIDIAGSVMVRVNEEDFVAEKLVRFDVSAIDAALDEIVPEDGIGLKEITSFGLFPYCGYPWNLFLIESYCRRFSQKFRFACLRSNSKNAGAVVRKTSKMDYHSLMAASLARSAAVLDADQAYDHLIDAGFLQRRRYKDMQNLLKLAADIREE